MTEPSFVPSEPNQEIIEAISKLDNFIDSGKPGIHNVLEAAGFYESVYRPTDELKQLIEQLKQPRLKTKEKGELLEDIAALSFACLQGYTNIDSYRSFESQLDLVVTMSTLNPAWKLLRLKGDTIVIEAKNLKSKVNVQFFERLCSILLTKFSDKGYLAIFFTLKGATGFPEQGSKRKVALRDARAVQVLFHAFTKDKYVIVFDIDDIKELSKPGSLIRLLLSKIAEVEKSTGKVPDYDGQWSKFDLPERTANRLIRMQQSNK